MIDEKKLIEAFRASTNTGKESFPIDFIIECIEEQPKVEKWIPVSECLPKDRDNRFYLCITEKHEEDLPMVFQYNEVRGFGLWRDICDEHTFTFLDSVFETDEEVVCEKVIAWQPLPEAYKRRIIMNKMKELQKPETVKKIRAINPEIIVRTINDKPYYSIRYFNLDDCRLHIGYSSYKFEFVVEWLRTYFDIIDTKLR